ncbi:hypothetical protein N8T08_008732 [Aspergillus melleus]|uniref:Uncharacterized protein n=1 Tax=Aspergillus melleus TaxID=138277 RepID=A0ACC3BDW9_9EURO|nr:hypothetical protein N8T08_008732 [Aspergillus melleus]
MASSTAYRSPMRGSGLSERSSLHAIERPSEVFAETPKLGRLELPDNRRHTITQPDFYIYVASLDVFDTRPTSAACWMSVDPCDVGRRQLLVLFFGPVAEQDAHLVSQYDHWL